MPTEFGKKLKELRESKKMTQADLATSLGIATRQVQRYEENTYPRPDKIKQLNRIFKYDFFTLMDDVSSRETKEADTPGKDVKGEDSPLVENKEPTQEAFLKILSELARNHTLLVEAHKIAVEANKTAAEANKIVVEANKLHAKNQETILSRLGNPEHESRGTLSVTDEIFARIKLVLAMLGTGQHPWKSEEEALEALDKLVPWRGLGEH